MWALREKLGGRLRTKVELSLVSLFSVKGEAVAKEPTHGNRTLCVLGATTGNEACQSNSEFLTPM